MNINALITAVRTRLLADTGSGGLFPVAGGNLVTAVYGMVAPSNAEPPYLLIDAAATDNKDGFSLDLNEVRFRVHLFALATDGFSPADAIHQRVIGEASRTPSYGLHRHALTLAGGSGWTTTAIQHAGTNYDNDEDHYHVIDDFITHIQRAST